MFGTENGFRKAESGTKLEFSCKRERFGAELVPNSVFHAEGPRRGIHISAYEVNRKSVIHEEHSSNRKDSTRESSGYGGHREVLLLRHRKPNR